MTTTLAAHPVEDPDQLALIADEWTVTRAVWAERFREACWADAETHGGWVNPNTVRALLGDDIDPRQYSALWSTACAKSGYLDKTEYPVRINAEHSRGNGNKSTVYRRWRGWGK